MKDKSTILAFPFKVRKIIVVVCRITQCFSPNLHNQLAADTNMYKITSTCHKLLQGKIRIHTSFFLRKVDLNVTSLGFLFAKVI